MAQKTAKKEQSIAAGGNVDKIREIIFGGQMRDYDRRFSQMEDRVASDIKRMQEDFDSRLNHMDTFVRRELDKLLDKHNTEKKERKESDKRIEGQLNESESKLSEEINAVDERLAKEQLEIRNQMRDMENELLGQITKTHNEIKMLMEKQIDLLHNDKVGRAELAEFLTEVAMRLNRDFEMPDPD